MNDTQPEALRLAQWLERDGANCQQHVDAASELRRLHADLQVSAATVEWWRVERDALREVLRELVQACDDEGVRGMNSLLSSARAAIAKTEEA